MLDLIKKPDLSTPTEQKNCRGYGIIGIIVNCAIILWHLDNPMIEGTYGKGGEAYSYPILLVGIIGLIVHIIYYKRLIIIKKEGSDFIITIGAIWVILTLTFWGGLRESGILITTITTCYVFGIFNTCVLIYTIYKYKSNINVRLLSYRDYIMTFKCKTRCKECSKYIKVDKSHCIHCGTKQ